MKNKEWVTYKMLKNCIETKYGFKVHTTYIAEVKRDLSLPMYDASNAIEELKQPRKHLSFLDEQTEAVTEYFETLVRRIISKIMVFDEKITVKFKSGLSMDVDA